MPFFLAFGGHEVRLAPGESIIGREKSTHVCLEDPSISRRHARVLIVQDVVTIEDLGSKNGVRVNGKRIRSVTRLGDGDRVRCGARDFVLRYSDGNDSGSHTQEFVEYRPPIYRTCPSCRNLMQTLDRRCEACGAEQVMQDYPTLRFWTDPEGRRIFFRKSVQLRAVYVSGSYTVEGEVSDLSPRGAFFVTGAADPVGTPCDLLVYQNSDGDVMRFPAEVVRSGADGPGGRGLGLRFVRVSADAQLWLMSITEAPEGGASDNDEPTNPPPRPARFG